MISIPSSNKPTPNSTDGTLYLLEITVDSKDLVKVGVTFGCIEDRVTGIVRSVFSKYRYFPYVKPKRFRVVENCLKKEELLLKLFSDAKYKPSKKFGGYTELLATDVDTVVAAYEWIIVNKDFEDYGR